MFTVDDVISRGIKETIQKYEETVSLLTKLIASYLGISTLRFLRCESNFCAVLVLFQASTMNVFLHYPGKYGKEFIKPFKIHPDTFVQLALQLTYYKLHGK